VLPYQVVARAFAILTRSQTIENNATAFGRKAVRNRKTQTRG
jgi:hypothetical protein